MTGIETGGETVAERSCWPEGQKIRSLGPNIASTTFRDAPSYSATLTEHLLRLEMENATRLDRGLCGTKLYGLDSWGVPGAALLTARAKAFYRIVFEQSTAVVDLDWANIYRNGDHCLPHSHLRTAASVVYFHALGDAVADSPLSGRFLFVDPRLARCCREEDGRVTTPFAPKTPADTMIIFPSPLVHSVVPYEGTTPRITLAWNIASAAIPGAALPAEADNG